MIITKHFSIYNIVAKNIHKPRS